MFIKSARLLAKLVLPAAGVVVDGLGGLASSGQNSGGGIDPKVWMEAYNVGREAELGVQKAYAAGLQAGLSRATGVEAVSDVFVGEVSATSAESSVPVAAIARGLFDLVTLSISAPWAVANSIVPPTPVKPVS